MERKVFRFSIGFVVLWIWTWTLVCELSSPLIDWHSSLILVCGYRNDIIKQASAVSKTLFLVYWSLTMSEKLWGVGSILTVRGNFSFEIQLNASYFSRLFVAVSAEMVSSKGRKSKVAEFSLTLWEASYGLLEQSLIVDLAQFIYLSFSLLDSFFSTLYFVILILSRDMSE